MFNSKCVCLIASILWCFTTPSCAQSVIENKEKKKSVTAQDSIKLNYYFEQLEALPLFSQKRGTYIDSVLTILPDNAYAWQQRAMPLLKQKKYEIAMPYLNKAVDLDPKKYLDYRAFIRCIFSKDYTGSIVDFKNAQKQFGTSIVMDHSYDFYMGLCYLQLNKLDSAEYLIAKTIEDEKKNRSDESWIHFLHWFYYGITQFEKDNYEKAIVYFDKSLKSYQQFSDAKFYKAMCLENLKKEKEALSLMIEASQDYEKGYTINEDNAIYEAYPYQVNKFYIKAYIDRMKQGK